MHAIGAGTGEKPMVWVESAGGPLIVLPEQALPGWSGFAGDYARVCEIDFVGVIPLGDHGEALVLADEPAATTYVPAWRAFVQWLYAEPDTDVLACVPPALADASWDAGPVFTVSGPLILFDAASPGPDVTVDGTDLSDGEPTADDTTCDGIRIDLAAGRYQVEWADVEPDEASCFRLHRLAPVTQ
jgi:Immunity protein 21